MDGQLARQVSMRMVLDIAAVKHWRAVKRVLQYMWRTKDVGITCGGTPRSCTTLSASVDADFATCPETRRSVSGVAVMLRGGAISWFSRMQNVTAAAISESEYVALAEVVNDLRLPSTSEGLLDAADRRHHNQGR